MENVNGAGLVPILLGVFGLLAFTGGVAASVGAVRRWRRERQGALTHSSAKGRVVDRYLPSVSSPHSEPPKYTIDFTTADKQVVRFVTDSVGLGPRKVGDTVDVLYDVARPTDAFVRGGERTAAYLLSIAGVIFTILGLLMALSALDVVMR